MDCEARGEAAPILIGVLQVEDAAILNSAGIDSTATAVVVSTDRFARPMLAQLRRRWGETVQAFIVAT